MVKLLTGQASGPDFRTIRGVRAVFKKIGHPLVFFPSFADTQILYWTWHLFQHESSTEKQPAAAGTSHPRLAQPYSPTCSIFHG